MITFSIGMNFSMVSLTDDIKRHLNVMNDDIKAEFIDRTIIHGQIAEFVQFHSDAKQLSDLLWPKDKIKFNFRISFVFFSA